MEKKAIDWHDLLTKALIGGGIGAGGMGLASAVGPGEEDETPEDKRSRILRNMASGGLLGGGIGAGYSVYNKANATPEKPPLGFAERHPLVAGINRVTGGEHPYQRAGMIGGSTALGSTLHDATAGKAYQAKLRASLEGAADRVGDGKADLQAITGHQGSIFHPAVVDSEKLRALNAIMNKTKGLKDGVTEAGTAGYGGVGGVESTPDGMRGIANHNAPADVSSGGKWWESTLNKLKENIFKNDKTRLSDKHYSQQMVDKVNALGGPRYGADEGKHLESLMNPEAAKAGPMGALANQLKKWTGNNSTVGKGIDAMTGGRPSLATQAFRMNAPPADALSLSGIGGRAVRRGGGAAALSMIGNLATGGLHRLGATPDDLKREAELAKEMSGQ